MALEDYMKLEITFGLRCPWLCDICDNGASFEIKSDDTTHRLCRQHYLIIVDRLKNEGIKQEK
jgi:hypothetical protein